MNLAFCLLLFAPDSLADLEAQLKRFIEAFTIIRESAPEPVPNEAIYGGAIPGLVRQLDPFSAFFDPGQFEQLKQMERSERKGFGSIVSVLPGRVIFLQTLAGTPSARAGLSPGDEILAVNGIPLARLEFEQIIQLLSEARQRQAQLIVRRPGSVRPLTFSLTPELMDAPSVDRAWNIEPEIGYLRITSFDTGTGKLVREKVEQLGGTRLRGLVIDLRGNPGGVVAAAVEIASLFLAPDQVILRIRGRNAEKSEEIPVPKAAKPYSFPVALLVNAETASASEILAGAIQDHRRGKVIGLPTYGKGLVQGVFPLSDGTGLALTTAYYYTPSGRSIQKPLRDSAIHEQASGAGGIRPDIEAGPALPTRLRAALDASGTLTTFATEYLQKNKIREDFRVPAALLDELKVYAAERRIQPGVGEWLQDREWIASRLLQELLSLAFGVAKGDEVEMRRDPVVQRALESLRR